MRCKYQVKIKNMNFYRTKQCSKNAVKDGYCLQHFNVVQNFDKKHSSDKPLDRKNDWKYYMKYYKPKDEMNKKKLENYIRKITKNVLNEGNPSLKDDGKYNAKTLFHKAFQIFHKLHYKEGKYGSVYISPRNNLSESGFVLRTKDWEVTVILENSDPDMAIHYSTQIWEGNPTIREVYELL
jgi:hypothetical protein